MATTFTNQAALRGTGIAVLSNLAVGQINDVLSVTKNIGAQSYGSGDTVTYTVGVVNTGATAITGAEITDSLGAYTVSGLTVYPLTYVTGTALVYINGVLVQNPTITYNQTLTVSGLTIPAGGSAVLVYDATVNNYAQLATGSTISNTATVTGDNIATPMTATATLPVETTPDLSVTKSISPIPVAANSTLTYTFLIQNYGNTAAVETDNLILSDTFNPILSGITATLNGTALTATTDYTYNSTTGAFATVASVITVPAATSTQDPTTGAVTVVPGTATLVITGTI